MTQLNVRRRDGRYPADEVKAIFERYGIVVLKELLPSACRDDLRAMLERKLAEAADKGKIWRVPLYPDAQFLLGDVLSIRELEELDYIFFREEALQVIRALLDSDEVLYFGDSSVQFGEAARGFHKDNVQRYDGAQDDWHGEYGLVRCGFYMQDHVKHSGGLKIRLKSHNYPTHKKGRMLDVPTSFGDLAIWSMRLTHSGNARKLKVFSGIPLHPRLEMICPRPLYAPEQMRRIGAFCSFGRPGSHADRYINNLDVRAKDYKPFLQRARHPREAGQLLGKRGVSLRAPFEYYGELD